jgi:cytochrome c biogenesis protein CcdA
LLTKRFGMDDNKLMRQVSAIFSVFMVFFYFGAGIYMIFFFRQTTLDKSILIIFGSVLIFYGIYRAYVAFVNIVNLFFKKDNDSE